MFIICEIIKFKYFIDKNLFKNANSKKYFNFSKKFYFFINYSLIAKNYLIILVKDYPMNFY